MGLTCNCYDYNDNNSIMISKIESSHRNSSMNEEPERRINKKEFNEIIFSKINTVKNEIKNYSQRSSNQSNFREQIDMHYLTTNCKEKNEEINIPFIFNDTKELNLSVIPSLKFNDVIEQLKDKYNWIKNYDDISFYLNDKKINDNIVIKDLGIKDDDIIKIKAN